MANKLRDTVVSGPAYTGAAQSPSIEEMAKNSQQAKVESDPMNRISPDQGTANDFFRAVEADGMNEMREAGIPEGIFKGMAIDPTKPITEGMVRERYPHDFGIGSVTAKTMRDYGINPEYEVPVWDLRDGYGGGDREYEREHLENNLWDREVRYCGKDPDKQGKKCTLQGMVLFARPKNVQAYIDGRFNDIAKMMPDGIDKGGLPGLPESEYEIDLSEKSQKLAEIRKRTNESIAQMLQGSPSAALGPDNLDRAMKFFTPEETQAFKAAARYPNGAVSGGDKENARDKTAETLKGSVTGRSLHSMGAGFDAEGKLVRS